MDRVRRAGIAALVLVVALRSTASPRVVRRSRPRPVAAASVAWPTVDPRGLGGPDGRRERLGRVRRDRQPGRPRPVDLNGLEVVYATSSGSTVTRKATWAASPVLEPGRRVLIANGAGPYAAAADAVYTGGFAATGGARRAAGRRRRRRSTRSAGATPTNAFVEGTAAAAPAAGSSLERRPGGSARQRHGHERQRADWVRRGCPRPQELGAAGARAGRHTESDRDAGADRDADARPPTVAPTPTPMPSATPTVPPTPTPTPVPSRHRPRRRRRRRHRRRPRRRRRRATPTPMPTPTPTPTPTPSPTPDRHRASRPPDRSPMTPSSRSRGR